MRHTSTSRLSKFSNLILLISNIIVAGSTPTGATAAVYPDEMDKGAISNHVSIGQMLAMWKRSVYKVVYRELMVFLLLFGIISAVYRNALDDNQKKCSFNSHIIFCCKLCNRDDLSSLSTFLDSLKNQRHFSRDISIFCLSLSCLGSTLPR